MDLSRQFACGREYERSGAFVFEIPFGENLQNR